MVKMTIYEKLRYLAMGGRKEYLHGSTENKRATKLQNFLDDVCCGNPEHYKNYTRKRH